MPKRKGRRRARALCRWCRRKTESPKIKILGLSVSLLLVALKLAELGRQLVSAVT